MNARFLHGLAQMLNHVLRGGLVTLEEVCPGVLATNLTVINRVFIVDGVA